MCLHFGFALYYADDANCSSRRVTSDAALTVRSSSLDKNVDSFWNVQAQSIWSERDWHCYRMAMSETWRLCPSFGCARLSNQLLTFLLAGRS